MTALDVFTKHAPALYLGVEDDCLTIAGRRLDAIVAQVGRTPFYVYSREALSKRVAELRAALPRSIRLHYAVKANPMPAVVHYMAGLTDGLDVASAREMQIALEAGASADRVSFAGPGKSPDELTRAVAANITLNVESELELDRLAQSAAKLRRPARVAIRVNPDFELKTSGMKMGGGPKQFGIDAENVPTVLKSLAGRPFELMGLHIFSGSQNLRAEAIVEAQRKSFELAVQLAEHAPTPLRRLNLGGGFGIPYFPGEQRLDLKPIGANLAQLADEARTRLPGVELIIELGRYLVGEAGFYVCRVLDRKVSRGQVFLVTDGGLHHHLAASGNFGQVLRKNYPVLIGNRVRGQQREIASVVGPLCTPLDLLADRMELAVAQVDDLVVVTQSGAYGLTASPTRFLGHDEPSEILL
jgi:diaminopimelate decarboxylase